jgi:uncharacterized protein
MKFLLLIGLIVGVAWLVSRLSSSAPQQPTDRDGTADPQKGEREQMVACIHCGVHLPHGEAIESNTGWFCSEAHREAHGGVGR